MFLTNLLGFKRKCNHDLITPDMESGYCPECGEFIENQWYITRCACCGLKLRTTQRGNSIEPQNTYCSNCGSTEFKVIKLEKINFIDINFAVFVNMGSSFTVCIGCCHVHFGNIYKKRI